jgi:CubicO group peptidase (beta-lactamase class C family)
MSSSELAPMPRGMDRSLELPVRIPNPACVCKRLLVGILLSCFSMASITAKETTLSGILSNAIKENSVIGAQLIEGTTQSPPVQTSNFGSLTSQRKYPVTNETMFCIASCSKPLVSSLIFTLVEQNKLDLQTPGDKWLPSLRNLKLADGTPSRAPNLRELLTHRGGVYSQKKKLTPTQLKAIRDFRLSLSQSVDMISQQPLTSEPGLRYAYSGAGYCLIGAIAEQATDLSIDTLLQTHVCEPLGMQSTTFFPNRSDASPPTTPSVPRVATGGNARTPPPHLLGSEMRLPLVGGSIHTTAEDLQRFARMIANRGKTDRNRVMTLATWSSYLSRPYKQQRYGYGWTHTVSGNHLIVSHNGSLPPSQAALKINLTTGVYTIALWTLSDPDDTTATSQLRARINLALKAD